MCPSASCSKTASKTRRQWLQVLLGGTLMSWSMWAKAQEASGNLSSFFTKRIPGKPVQDEALSRMGGASLPSTSIPTLPPTQPPTPVNTTQNVPNTGSRIAPPEHLYPSAPATKTPSPITSPQHGVTTSPLPDSLQPQPLQAQPLPQESPIQERVFGQTPNNANRTLPEAPIQSATPAPIPPSPFPPFQIISLQGDVRINGGTAYPQSTIAVGDELSTGQNGSVIYRWLDEIIKVYPSTILAHGAKPSQWMQLKGRITVSSKSAPEPRVLFTDQVMVQMNECSFHVDSSLITYGSTGEAVETAYVCMCFGQGNLARTQNPSDLLQINAYHHNFPQFVAPRQFQPTAEVLGHNDAEIILLQSILQQIG